MIRADRWSAVYAEVERELKTRVPDLMKQASHRWGAMRWPADAIPPGGVRPENAAYISEEEGEIRHMFVVMTGRTIGPSRIGAAYPFVPHGTAYDVEIKALHPHETGIEGEVSAVYAGQEFRFFEPLWGVRRSHYKPGTVQRIRFAAFGHALSAINGAKPAEAARPADAPGVGPLMPPAPAIALPSALVMIGPGASSRYGMHAPIVEWRGFWTGERLYYALKLRLFDSGGQSFAVDLYAGRHCFKEHFSPAAGVAVAGVMWLHGTLAD
jgi:hypothetical protein